VTNSSKLIFVMSAFIGIEVGGTKGSNT